MKRGLLLVVALVTLAFAVAPSASASEQKSPTLRQFRALQAQVKTLQRQVKVLRNEIAANYVGDACIAASTADVFQSTWANVDSRAPSGTLFGAQTQINDQGACQAIRIARHGATRNPPTASIFATIINWLI
jgi:hypothetical protein